MADKKITALTAGTTPIDADVMVYVDSTGTPTTKKITWANIKTTLAAVFAPAFVRAEWRADTHAGYGGTDTRIPYFTNVRATSDTGGAITVVNNSTNGCKVTINTAGVYAVGYYAFPSGGSYIGLSLNSATLTTDVSAITASSRLALDTSAGADYACNVAWTGYLAANDIIRPHTQATGTNYADRHGFSICRVA